MSIHFAPQWVKPIKPSGTSLTPTSENPISLKNASSHSNTAPSNPNASFPALSHPQRAGVISPTTGQAPHNSQPLSYSRVTHTPLSPSFPNEPSYFPYQEPNGNTNGVNGDGSTSHPFRYGRDQILNLFDEIKFKERPIELVEMAEGGGVLVSKSVNKPIGLRDLSEIEKKLLATSIHPPPPTRRQNTHGNASNANTNAAPEPPTPNGLPSRRAGGFARGEGGAFGGGLGGKIGTIGGGLISPGGLDSKAPGALGGGFGGVGKRLGRVRGDAAEGGTDGTRSTGPNWRPARTASGSFEGVLGFGSNGPSALSTGNPLSPNPNTDVSEGGGPGWGTGQKKWRIAAGLSAPGDGDKTLEVPIANEPSSVSVVATPSATPVPERDATVLDSISAPVNPHLIGQAQELAQQPQPEEKQDLGAIEWFYRDPNGQEQGPFTGTQMHDWYSHSYFTDDLPLRRASETTFRPLAELKVSTGNAVQPFLSPIRPRQLPPNLPIPVAALQQQVTNGLPDTFRNLNVSSPIAADPRVSPQPPIQHTPQQFNQPFLPERAPYSPGNYGPGFNGQLGSPAAFGPTPGQGWGMAPGAAPGGPRLNGPFGSIGMPSPIGQGPLPFMPPQHQQQFFSPQIGSPVRNGDLFSPSAGVGAIPTSPWGMPQPPQPQHSPAYAPQIPQQQQQAPPASAWSNEQQYQQQPPVQQEQEANPEIEQAVTEALSPVSPQDQVFEPVVPEATQTAVVEGTGIAEEPAPAATEVEQVAETPQREASPEPQAPTPAKAPASVWGQTSSKAPSRKASIASPAPSTPSTPASAAAPVSSKLPPAPASLPAKPAAPAKQPSTSEPVSAPKTVAPATPGPTAGTSSGEKPPIVSTKPAPWAIKEEKDVKALSSPSLREIQEAEAKHSEARKAALAEVRAATSSPAPTPSLSNEDFPTSMAWGLPSSKPSAPSPAPATPSAPAWGGNDSAPKKTLKQIQEEEEKRKAKAAQAARATQGAPGLPSAAGAVASQKRGYADLAANAASAPAPAGWTTVGASGKSAGAATSTAARVVSTPVSSKPATPVKPSTSVPSIAAVVGTPKKANGSSAVEDASAPSVEFIRWVKGALNGFKGDVDDFINNVLLQFPIDIPAPSRADTLEIISDGVYANSSTLDGRRFAQEFYTKRKADSQRKIAGGGAGVTKITSLADVVKTQAPKAKGDDFGFKIVKGKGKKKN
uniref:GYF domain-containing protein n=1 Tax=Kwoniella bestiolae CBS 10118 TaxID=1296100 RepID=A0A1B9G7H1_9TREE|nr:hypothetical protein I302_04671 [Kwoniella bestiolae CBS 10118]OCF26979.1 hypothetical protein I302_04671 [Kwoniella bestiolae CBS 10118]